MGRVRLAAGKVLRRVRFAPYTKGQGPRFALTVWDTRTTDSYGKCVLGYRLNMDGVTLFQGEDYHCAPSHAINGDATVRGIMVFLTLRPGDTDAEYFADYTDAQREYCDQHAEYLGYEVSARFGED